MTQRAGTAIADSAIERLLARERERFAADRPVSAQLARDAAAHWLGGVPMHWMLDWGTPFPVSVVEARDAELIDVDGLRYVDFCLGDTGAMFGHSPAAVAAALRTQAERGLTCMLPSSDAPVVGQLLASRFGLPVWQMAQTASDANRAVLRWARAITGRPKVLVFDGCYHGAVEDALVELAGDRVRSRPGLVGQVSDVASHVRVVEFNDAEALERALATGDVACVLAEPVMTNAGMVLPEPGFLDALRKLTASAGTLLVIDETHTISSGPGGHARTLGLEADFLVVGKAIAGGFPCAVYGCTTEMAAGIDRVLRAKPAGHSGIGTTLSGNPLALAALRANLEHVMTEPAYARMTQTIERLCAGLEALIARHELAWNVSRVGARAELGFTAHP
ncbi:MAG TPA: transaminase, partial [Steroidobacteraceae bacterium]|nr:transaminase [Steroidobacteraceae bacterium]